MKARYCFIIVLIILFGCFLIRTEIQAVESVKKNVEVIVLSDSSDEGFEPYRAMDGNTKTMWHSEWKTAKPVLPHTLTVDLLNVTELTGFVV
ncbi:MAG: discoidin domain-containing protein, partial [Planctomycetaceae bacterium]|nr:discoidin domain-containing protein [Planctomycetaceae bacterium]